MWIYQKAIFFSLGMLSLSVGLVGVVLPLIPTTPLLLLAAGCFARSSERLHHWVLYNKYFGDYVRAFQEGKKIPLKTKIFAISMVWIFITVSALFFVDPIALKLMLFLIALLVSLYISSK
ncbi:YbaN family protein [Bacillaceae bacterium W0354]